MDDYNLIFYGKLQKALKERAFSKCIEMGYGNVEDYPNYKRECGIIEGLNEALIIVEDVLKEIQIEERNG